MRIKMRSCERKSLSRTHREFGSQRTLAAVTYRVVSMIAPVFVVALLFGAAAYSQTHNHDHIGAVAPVMGLVTMKSKELREQHAKLIADSRKILDEGEMTPEKRTKIDALDKDIDRVAGEITLHEKQEQRERELAISKGEPIIDPGAVDSSEARKKENELRAKQYSETFEQYLRVGYEELSGEQRKIMKLGWKPDPKNPNDGPEGRALSAATGSLGGFTAPQGFMAELETAAKAYGGFSDQCRHIKTTAGSALPWPTLDDTGNSGVDIAENTAPATQDTTFGSVTLNAYKMSTGIVLIPNELFEDTGLPLAEEIATALGIRIGRRKNNKYTLGAGSTTFTGAVTALTTNGTVVTAASATAIAADELFDIQHKVDPAYRNNPKVAWVMHDDVLKAVRKLKDSQNRYLFEPSLTAGAPGTILGKPYVINQDMSNTFTTGQKLIMYGDWSKFVIRDVRDLIIRRLNERYADADQVGYIGFYRGDSNLVAVSGTKALTYYKLA
jgi:HK97 family phage major capsid protein